MDYDFPFQHLPISILHQIHLDKKYPFLTGLGELLAVFLYLNLKIDVLIGNPISRIASFSSLFFSENVKSLARLGPGDFFISKSSLAPCSPGNLVHTDILYINVYCKSHKVSYFGLNDI